MLHASISAPIHIHLNFPFDYPPAIEEFLAAWEIEGPLSKIKLTDSEADGTHFYVSGDTEVDAHLAKLFTRDDSLYDVNVIANVMENLDERIKEKVEKNVISDAYPNIWKLQQDIRHQSFELGATNEVFYFPIKGNLYYDEEYSWIETADTGFLLKSEHIINNLLRGYMAVNGIYMHQRYDGPGCEKLTFAEWGFEEWEGTLYGYCYAKLTESFTKDETESFKDWIFHQNAEYLGHDFKEEGVFTDQGFLRISLWSDPDNYFVYDFYEMLGYIYHRYDMLLDTYDNSDFDYPDMNGYLYQFGGM